MRAVIQRVQSGLVSIDGTVTASIDHGLVCLIGISQHDTEKDAQQLAAKIMKLRIFDDVQGKLNDSVVDQKGQVLLVSQFTLYGDCKKGNRPSFVSAMAPDNARELYKKFVEICHDLYPGNVHSGVFQADMLVAINNDGPITILMDTEKQL